MNSKFSSSPITKILILIMCLVSCIALIYSVDFLELKYRLRKDLSFNSYASLSKQSEAAIKNINNKTYIYTFKGSTKDKLLEEVFKSYNRLNNKIEYEIVDLAKKPDFLNKFNSSDSISIENTIIYSPITKKYKIIPPQDYMSLSYSIEMGTYNFDGIRYEKTISEALLYVNNNSEKEIYISRKNGENNQNSLDGFITYTNTNAYKISFIDDFSRLDEKSLLFIPSPRKDFNEEQINEILSFARKGGNFLIGIDSDVDIESMPKFKAFLESYGINVLQGHIEADKNDTKSYYKSPSNLLPYMQSDVGFLNELIQSNRDTILFPVARAIDIKADKNLNIASLLKSGKNSSLIYEEKTLESNKEFTLAAIAEKAYENSFKSKLVLIGSTAAISNKFIFESSYASEFLQKVLNELMPQASVDLDIAIKPAFRPAMSIASRNVAYATVILLPLISSLIGLVVLYRRRKM